MQTVTLIADLFKEWELPYGPVTGLLSVKTRTGNEGSGPGTYETLSSGWTYDGNDFVTFTPAPTGGFNPGAPFTGHFQWGPYSSDRSLVNRYKIVYTSGYANVPDALKLAILNEITYRYENRGSEAQLEGICFAARTMAEPYKRTLWF
jgi:hypothetical protein